ncbi:MAG: response regulator [Syntrophales bacterium]|jgi:DNA-binding response OmpR family regulator|nr:response regulator [Syntrophales bacterium]NLN59962.1 response regulator [Deltaproteobacteria bacterium]
MYRILIVDDDDTLREVLVEYFESMGYGVMEASNGRDGLEKQIQNPADLVITDLIMPEENGLEMILEFQRRYPSLKIIAMTGSGHPGALEDLNTATILGADRTFPKPFQLEDLLKAVKELLIDSGS